MWDIASPWRNRLLRIAWIILAAACVVAMYRMPGQETIPFHLVWIGLCLLYGLTAWRPVEMVLLAVATAVVTGVVLVDHARRGAIDWPEVMEVPLSVALTAVIVVYLHRRHTALTELARRAADDRRRGEMHQQLLRQVSHELRTPITVARGYTELARKRIEDPLVMADTAVVLDELDKLADITQRLLTLYRVDGQYERHPLDLDSLLSRVVRRWMPAADRQWAVNAATGHIHANADRLEAALDCLLDNAVKFTRPGDKITVSGRIGSRSWSIEVSDSGVGLAGAKTFSSQGLPGTGLGLAMVRTVAGAWGGTVVLRPGPEGGTVVTLMVPHDDDSSVIEVGEEAS
jgi:signal transduction histidine kinase